MSISRQFVVNRRTLLRRARQVLVATLGAALAYGVIEWESGYWWKYALVAGAGALVLLYFRKFAFALSLTLACAGSWWVANREVESGPRLALAALTVLVTLTYLVYVEFTYISREFSLPILPHGQGTLTPGSARTRGQLLDLYTLFTQFKWERGGILLGTLIPQHRPFGLGGWRWLGSSDKPHLLTIAGSQSGKGTAALIPNLLYYPGSALVIDPKGELARATAARRGNGSERVTRFLGQRVFVLDPEHQVARGQRAHWNPLAEIDPASPAAVDLVRRIGFALVPNDQNNQNKFFQDMARELLVAGMLHVISDPAVPRAQRSLVGVRELIFGGDPALFTAMTANDAYQGAIKRIAQSFATMPADQLSNIQTDLQRFTSFMDILGVRELLSTSDFSLRDLKRSPMTIYLCVSGSGLSSTLKPLVHVFLDMAIQAMEMERKRPAFDVLFAIDEFDALGRVDSIDRAMGLIAGYGVKLWPVLQSESQLKAVYGEHRADNFMSNCAVIQYVGDQGGQTARELESRLGSVTVRRKDGTTEVRPVLDYGMLMNEYFSKESKRSLVRFRQKYYASLEMIEYYTNPAMMPLVDSIEHTAPVRGGGQWPSASIVVPPQTVPGAPGPRGAGGAGAGSNVPGAAPSAPSTAPAAPKLTPRGAPVRSPNTTSPKRQHSAPGALRRNGPSNGPRSV